MYSNSSTSFVHFLDNVDSGDNCIYEKRINLDLIMVFEKSEYIFCNNYGCDQVEILEDFKNIDPCRFFFVKTIGSSSGTGSGKDWGVGVEGWTGLQLAYGIQVVIVVAFLSVVLKSRWAV